MIRIRVAQGCKPTARILQSVLQQLGVGATLLDTQPPTAYVNWGVGSHSDLPTLNANAGRFDKLQQLIKLQEAGVRIPHTWNLPAARDLHAIRQEHCPVLGRQRHHVGGRDIILVMQPEEIQGRIAAGAEFFTQFIPSIAEYRTWVYRRRHLGTYQKVLTRPTQFRGIGRNYNNGFSFQLVHSEQIPPEVPELAGRAVDALGLDFGATDIIRGVDGNFYVLEVNTAPGIESDGRQVVQALGQKIQNWIRLNYPRRNGDESNLNRRGNRA